MRFTTQHTTSLTTTLSALVLLGCPVESATEKSPRKTAVVKSPRTAMKVIREIHDSLERDCGRDLDEIDITNLASLELSDAERGEANALLIELSLYAQQCGSYVPPSFEDPETCGPDCGWCPIEWYWCIENAGACAGGDNKSCCKLGACGSKHHCELVCKSSCGCNVPPLPSDGGGEDGDD
jgi:hypothetical protein